jgi:phenylalanyl-tRNA synthetase alpha chain
MEQLRQLVEKYQQEVEQLQIQTAEELENFRIKFLGSKSIMKDLFLEMKGVANEQKKDAGQLLNSLKIKAEDKFAELAHLRSDRKSSVQAPQDWTLPVSGKTGSRHPLTIVGNEINSIFGKIGFSVAEAREIEDDWHNFSALNIAADHPARDMQDTFFVQQNPDIVLRTHTSSVQVRLMENSKPPIRSIMPGRVYRNETISARAHCFFHQVEGLYIDKKVSFVDLKQTLYFFVTQFFGKEVKIRFRPSYFPFTEPSAEMDISCFICGGSGCSVCKQSGWVEILGCGMVHPQVLINCGIDPEAHSGFAFGMGIERLTMLKYQIKDLRLFSENDQRFIQQFANETITS